MVGGPRELGSREEEAFRRPVIRGFRLVACRPASVRAMRHLAAIGSFLWVTGLVLLVAVSIGDSATPQLDHTDVLFLAMTISGAVLAVGADRE